MATILLCNRISGDGRRIKVDNVDLKEKVNVLRTRVASLLNIDYKEIELVYCGRTLKDTNDLEEYDVKPGITVHALKRKAQQGVASKTDAMSESEVKQVVSALQAAMTNPAYRSTVDKMLNDKSALENIVAATPGLDKDPVAIAMLQDPELLGMLADPSHVKSVVERHPALGQAAMLLAAAVKEESKTARATGRSRTSSRGTYSLDQMSDDEDLMDVRPNLGAGSAITTSQLAAALMAAGAPGGSSQSGGGGSSSSPSTGGISSDAFSQAMQGSGTDRQETTQENIETQLAQMRDMGITDETVARQALEATGGNMAAALEMMFGDLQ